MIKRVHIGILLMIILLFGCSKVPSVSILPLLDNFEQQENRIAAKMDILWVIDNSGSMKDEQEALRENFNSFITNFIKKGYDYRIAVITTDAYYTGSYYYDSILFIRDEAQERKDYKGFALSGENDVGVEISSYLTSGFVDGDLTRHYCTIDLLSGCPEGTEGYMLSGYKLTDSSDDTIDFTEYEPSSFVYDIDHEDYISNNIKNIFAINSNVGTQGIGYESGLRSVQTALNNPTNQALNFPRPDAHLAVIVVSDEEDQIEESFFQTDGTLGSVINDIPVIDYHNFLTGLVHPEYGYSFHTIARLEANPCYDGEIRFGPSLGVGTRYIELSKLSGGIQASICEDFAESLSDIAQTIIEKTVEFPLTDVPADSNKLEVSVKNPGATAFLALSQSMDNGWTYNGSKNSIIFHGEAIPAQGSEISVFYDPDGL